MKIIQLSIILICLCSCFDARSDNRVVMISADTAVASEQELFFIFDGLAMAQDRTAVDFTIRSVNLPFELHKVEFMTGDSVLSTIEPFVFKVDEAEAAGHITEWKATAEFPPLSYYDTTDRLVVETDLGRFEIFTSREAILLNETESEKTRIKRWTVASIICVSVIGLIVIFIYSRRLRKREDQMKEMAALSDEYRRHACELQTKVNDLYGERMSTLNMLCNEYFERSASEKLRLSLYNRIENHILEMKSPEAVNALEKIVNRYLDNIISRLRNQLPSLTRNDLTFMTYLYAGFSPRAVSILCDIKIKNFYNRRSRLKEKIATSDAPDKELFIGKM